MASSVDLVELEWRMAATEASFIDRRALIRTLRDERELAGFTQEQVAKAMEWSLSKIVRIEKGAVGVSTNDLKALLQLYGVTDERQVEGIIDLARSARRRRPWWSAYRGRLPEQLLKYVDLEGGAAELRLFYTSLVPGLLQTEAYARAAILATSPGEISADEVEQQLIFRLRRRQEIFDRTSPPILELLLDEAAVRRVGGSRAVMRDQLAHLVMLSRWPNVSIRIVPFSVGLHASPFGPFILLGLPGPAAPALYVENVGSLQILRDRPDDADRIEAYRKIYDRLRTVALDEAESLSFLRGAADQLG
jgi:transcriptional regulator with XRE-family HTH domain